MALYVVTAVRVNDDDEIELFMWAKFDPNLSRGRLLEEPHIASMEDIIGAIRGGDVVEMTFETGMGTVSGEKLLEVRLPSGDVTETEDRAVPGRMISDLPRF
ncbi:hypothetical protein D3879_22810 [Pseudomonas cavernicola]|uniref:Uncharacterized protein n=1 Tax=Pseudomonas cavernicola TaxID=2320866 RepID=A0A418X8L2_9PSED|nr:hypothetical protein [Pseudomonas cavernicola]RJG08713.1 hypothetical protein D3879_22810 [Pseudomonas cavernicola]